MGFGRMRDFWLDDIIRIIIFIVLIVKNFDRNRLQKIEEILRMYGLVKERVVLSVIGDVEMRNFRGKFIRRYYLQYKRR